MRAIKPITSAAAILFSALLSEPSLAGDGRWKASSSINYETGTYGSGSRTDTFYIPVTLKRYFKEGDLSFTVPYISQKNGAGVVTVDGSVFGVNGTAEESTVSGLGDIVLKGSYYLLTEDRKTPFDINLTAKLKVPTGDDSKGLGTGEFDTGMGLEFAKALPEGFFGYFDIYYTYIGDPPGLELEDRLAFDLGLSKRLAPQWTMSAFYEESTPLVKPNANLRDVMVNFEFKADGRTRLFFGGTMGLSETSPDYGLSVGASILL